MEVTAGASEGRLERSEQGVAGGDMRFKDLL